jgi:hypothetical protein
VVSDINGPAPVTAFPLESVTSTWLAIVTLSASNFHHTSGERAVKSPGIPLLKIVLTLLRSSESQYAQLLISQLPGAMP